MPINPNNRLAMLERQKAACQLYLRGHTQHEIARKLHVSQKTISRDLQAVHKAWLKSALRDFDALKAEQFAKINALERVAWEAWDKSQEDVVTRQAETADKKEMKRFRSKRQFGDPRFLERIAWCLEQRCKLVGLYAKPAKLKAEEQQGSDTDTEAQRIAIIRGLVADFRRSQGRAPPGPESPVVDTVPRPPDDSVPPPS